jgi:hypothetical protein
LTLTTALRVGRERRGGLEMPAAYRDGVKYLEEARSLWQTPVPASGHAATVQGELLRAVEKLRDEAQRNGNLNWGSGHEVFIEYSGEPARIRADSRRSTPGPRG